MTAMFIVRLILSSVNGINNILKETYLNLIYFDRAKITVILSCKKTNENENENLITLSFHR